MFSYREFYNYYEGKKAETITHAYPKNLLKPIIVKQNIYEPMSVGVDGFIYGRQGNYSNQIHRTGDTYETVEYGADFGGLNEGNIVYVTRTKAGYVVALSTGNTASVYFSESFTSGFEKVLEMPNGGLRLWSISPPVFDYKDGLLLFGEYAQTNTPKNLYMSTDGGRTWKVIATTKALEGQQRSHWHTASFDPVFERIYAQSGDIENAQLLYSDDFGETWKEIDLGLEPPLQTTLLAQLPAGVAMCPDRGGYLSAIWMMEKDFSRKTTADEEKFIVEHKLTVANLAAPYQYAGGPYIVDGNIAYIPFMDFGAGSNKIFIVGTGDGGRSWHHLYSASYDEGSSSVYGIVGIDKNGKMVMKIKGENKMLIFEPAEWVFR